MEQEKLTVLIWGFYKDIKDEKFHIRALRNIFEEENKKICFDFAIKWIDKTTSESKLEIVKIEMTYGEFNLC